MESLVIELVLDGIYTQTDSKYSHLPGVGVAIAIAFAPVGVVPEGVKPPGVNPPGVEPPGVVPPGVPLGVIPLGVIPPAGVESAGVAPPGVSSHRVLRLLLLGVGVSVMISAPVLSV